MSNEIVKREGEDVAESLISRAIEKGMTVEALEKLLAMRTQLRQEKAKELFDIAMSELQGECPIIAKIKAGGKTNAGQIAYYYAPLEEIVGQVKEIIRRHGFSYLVKAETTEQGVKVNCIVKHIAGHSEQTEISMPFGTKTNVMSQPQVVASALTFAKRYAFCNAFGIMTADEDNDGQIKQPTGKAQELPKASEPKKESVPPANTNPPETYKLKLYNLLKAHCSNNEEDMKEQLIQLTEFTNNDGKLYKGKDTIRGLSEKQAQIAYGKLKALLEKNKPKNNLDTAKEMGQELKQATFPNETLLDGEMNQGGEEK